MRSPCLLDWSTDCFTVSLDRPPSVYGFVLLNFGSWQLPFIPLCLLTYEHISLGEDIIEQFPLSICDFMVKFLYPLQRLSFVLFQIWNLPTGSETLSVSIFSLKKVWVGVTAGHALGVLMEYCVFHEIFLNLITSWTRDYKTSLVVLQHGTSISLRGQGSACPKSWPGV